MRIFSCLTLLLILSLPSIAQQHRERLKEKSFNPADFEEFKVEIKKSRKDVLQSNHYKNAIFIDCRPDTTKIGFALVGGANTSYHRIILPRSLAEYFTNQAPQFLNVNDTATADIVFFIKQLWVSEAIVKPATYGRSMLTGPLDYMSYAYLNADCFNLKNGLYNYIGKIDTVYSLRKWIANAADDLLKKTITETLFKGDSLFTANTRIEKPMEHDFLLAKYKSHFDLPVLKHPPVSKGVFMTYNDFLDNKISFPGIELKKDKNVEWLAASGVDDSVLNKAWGYFDGKNYYMHVNEEYFRMVPVDHSFDVLGPRKIKKMYSSTDKILNTTINTFFMGLANAGFALMVMGSTNDIIKENIPYQLNIRDGLLY